MSVRTSNLTWAPIVCSGCGLTLCSVCGGCGCPALTCDCIGDPLAPQPVPPAMALDEEAPECITRLRLDRARDLARMGFELREAKRTETDGEKRARWQAERELRAAEQSRTWEWRRTAAGWVVDTGTLTCRRLGGYLVTEHSCSCDDARAKRCDRCKHMIGLSSHLAALDLDRRAA